MATIFRYWLSEENNGAVKAARVIIATDKHLLRTLKRELHPEDYELISDQLNEIIPMSIDQRNELIIEFGSMLHKGSKQSISERKRNKFSLFKFLDHIPERHVLTLLETEDTLSGAFILNYIPEETAASLLKQLNKEIAANIMLKIASLNSLTNDQQQSISSNQFDKAMDLVEAEKSEQYGAEHLYPILEKIPVFDQKQYIDELRATGSVIGAILNKNFITIDMLVNLDTEIIKQSVSSFNTETLLDAIVGLDDDVIEKIISTRPKREQRLLKMELNELKDLSISETEYAKSQLMNAIRKNATRSQQR